MPRSVRACRTVGNARKGPSFVRWVTCAIIAAHISRADNVLSNDSRCLPAPTRSKQGHNRCTRALPNAKSARCNPRFLRKKGGVRLARLMQLTGNPRKLASPFV
jgi:hypothetical protein